MQVTNLEPPSMRSRSSSLRGRPTREQSEERHNNLLDQALDLFLERGFEGTSMEAIVSAAGTARRTVYSRYGDKDSLFKAALQRLIDRLVVPADTLARLESSEMQTSLRNVADLVLSRMRSPDGVRLTRIANAEVFRVPEIGAYFWARTSQVTIDYLKDLFDRRMTTPSAEDAALSFYFLVIEGSYRSWIWLRPSEQEFERALSYRIELFLRGTGNLPKLDGPPDFAKCGPTTGGAR